MMGEAVMTIDNAIANARRKALEDAIAACEREKKVFLSPDYATGQPQSSMQERFGVASCIDAIRALLKDREESA